jgi:hypothetical protein
MLNNQLVETIVSFITGFYADPHKTPRIGSVFESYGACCLVLF